MPGAIPSSSWLCWPTPPLDYPDGVVRRYISGRRSDIQTLLPRRAGAERLARPVGRRGRESPSPPAVSSVSRPGRGCWRGTRPRRNTVITLGIILLILGALFHAGILWAIGGI